ncbi:MAG TPA: nitrate ABC transporter permease [Chloroflexota bacterium]|nr:nitrate ABC transporter permease [Chloroflexota bacterium]
MAQASDVLRERLPGPVGPTGGGWAAWPVGVRAAALALVLLAVGLGVWELLVRAQVLLPIMPAPSKVLARALAMLSDPFYVAGTNDVGIGWQLLSSLRRVATGFALAALVAVPLGFVIGMSAVAAKAVDPFVQVLRPVSPLAWLPMGLAVLQDSERTAVFVIFISAMWPIVLNTIFGVRQVPRTYVDIARIYNASAWTIIRRVLLPGALPSILTGLRISLGIAWLVIVAAEMLIGGRGIGYFVWNEWNNLDIASIIVCIGVIGAVGLGLDRLFGLLERAVAYAE